MSQPTNKLQRGRRHIVTGKVISSKMDKTISVLIYNLVKHPRYKKYIKKTSVFKVHDQNNQAKEGDIVRIVETRALSKTKRWKLMELMKTEKSGDQLKNLNLEAELPKLKKVANSSQPKQDEGQPVTKQETDKNQDSQKPSDQNQDNSFVTKPKAGEVT